MFGNENRISKSLRDSFVMKPLQDSCQKTTGLLSRNYRTLIKKLQESYQKPANLQNSYQETTGLLSRNYRTPIKELQDSYQEPTGLISKEASAQ